MNAYYNGGEERRSERVASRATATEKCVVCGKEFPIIDARTLCCSPECSEIHALNLRKKWANENEERIRETNRKRWAENGAERNRKRKEARKIEREKEGVTMPGDKDYKAQWDYAILENAESRGGVVRQLMRLGFKVLTEVPGGNTEKEV